MIKYILILLISFEGAAVWAQDKKNEAPARVVPQAQNVVKKNQIRNSEPPIKKSIIFDYHSWFENLNFIATDNTASTVVAMNYGFALMYDLTQYYAEWGWGFQGGYGQGYAVGDGDTSSYLQKRVPWNYLRAGGRVFKRLNPRTDLGLNLLVMRKAISWPQSGGEVQLGSNPFFSLFLEMRWRLTREWEIIQALGNSTKNAGASLRLGFGYTF